MAEKSLRVKEETHKKIKVLASKCSVTIDVLLKEMIKLKEEKIEHDEA